MKNLGKLVFLIFCLIFTVGCKQGTFSSNSIGVSSSQTPDEKTTNQPLPINGQCDQTRNNGCLEGSLQDEEDNQTHYNWQCIGSNGGTNDDCSIAKPLPINGSCNESENNGCHEGSTLNDQADSNTHYNWQCIGSNGGTTDDCSIAKPLPINGSCNESQNNGCHESSTLNNQADSNTHYNWQCVGANGGTTDDCSIAKPLPINGSCNESQNNGCHEGSTLNDQADSNTHYNWQCIGSNGGTTDDCSIAKPLPINGSCNESQNNGCHESSTLNDQADSNTHYNWQCVGANGGTTDDCSIAKSLPINGSCNESQNNGCHKGSTLNNQADSNTHYNWQCIGSNGGTTDDCSIAKPLPINGSCNESQNNGCHESSTLNNQADSNTHYNWQCVGANGGTTDDCSIAKPLPINGSCNESQNNGCHEGSTLNNQADSDTHYNWQCIGSNGGTTDDCSIAKPLNGQCNQTRNNGCLEGSLQDEEDNQTHYNWQCISANGGTTDDCSIAKPLPINGSCNESQNNGCHEGSTLNNQADSDTHYNWQCIGSNGGTTDDCSIQFKKIENATIQTTQVTTTSQGNLDILMVIDTSGSMGVHQESLGPRFNNLISSSLNSLDWRMAFTNTDGINDPNLDFIDGSEGSFYNLENEDGDIALNGSPVKMLSKELEGDYNLQDLFLNTINRLKKKEVVMV